MSSPGNAIVVDKNWSPTEAYTMNQRAIKANPELENSMASPLYQWIEGMCNDYDKSLLISQTLKELMDDQEEFQINMVGEVMLRGKSQALKIYGIDEI